MKKKLAIVSTHPIQYQVPLFRELSKKNIEVDVFFSSKHGLDSKIKDKGFNKKFNWNINLLDNYNYYFSNKNYDDVDSWNVSFNNLESYLKKKNYNAILIFGWSNILYLKALYLARKLNIKSILRVETNLFSTNSFLKNFIKFFFLKYLFSKIDFFLFIGKLNFKFYKRFKIQNFKLYSAPYFVDNNFFSGKKKNKKKNKKVRFLFVGKLIERKNPILFLELAEKFKKKKNIIFNIVGSGPLEKYCYKYIEEKKLKNVRMLGFKNQIELKKIYSRNDYFVMTSHYETWGLVINEAMASGLPVITSLNSGAAHDLIKHNKNGYIFRTPNHLIKIISLLVKNRKLQTKLRRNVKYKIKQYSIDKTVRSIIKILYKS